MVLLVVISSRRERPEWHRVCFQFVHGITDVLLQLTPSQAITGLPMAASGGRCRREIPRSMSLAGAVPWW